MSDQEQPAASEQKPAPSEQAPPLSSRVDDSNDLRAFHFNRLLRKQLTWILTAIAMVAAGVAGLLLVGVVIAGIAVAGTFLLALLAVLLLADAASEDSFFDLYSLQRGMSRDKSGSLPPVTELLRKGDERSCEEIMRGPLADGVDGALALYTYTEVYHDKNGRHETDYPFTVATADLPDTVRHAAQIYCHRKSGLRALEGLEDALRTKQRVELESEALADKYEIFVSKDQDPNWIRQLFSPTFIVWLTESTPNKFAFELESGVLCCNVRGHKKSAKELDGMREAAAHVARRLREEALEAPARPAG